jgi:PAS domain S-box-containing protein
MDSRPTTRHSHERAADGDPPGDRAGRLRLLTEAARGIDAELPQDELLAVVAGIGRQVIGAHRCGIRLSTRPAGAQSISAVSLSDSYAASQPPRRGLLAAPLLDRAGESIGLIELSDKYEGDFTAEDEALLAHLAQLAVLAIEGARVRQEALQSRALLDALQVAGPVGFGLHDENLRFLRLNEALAEINGVPMEDHIGHRPSELLPELGDQLELHLRRALEGAVPTQPIEISGSTPAAPDEHRHWLVSFYPMTVLGRRGVGCAVIEVTESHLASERVRRSEERYRNLVETTQDLIWTVDPEGRFTFVSGTAERIYGYTAEELLGKHFLEFVPEDQHELLAARFVRAVSGEGSEGEAQLLRKDGSLRTVEFRSIPLVDDDGKVVAITGASTDVTERRRSERALRDSEERFRSLFEDAVIGMALLDTDDRFVHANPAFCRLLGRGDEELRELSWPEVVHPEDRSLAGGLRQRRLAAAGEGNALELRCLRGDGHPVWARVMAAAANLADPERYTLVQAIDLTEQRRLEEATSRLYALSRDLFCTLDFEGCFKSANPAWERALGYSPADLLTTPFLELVHPEDRPRTVREFERLRGLGELTLNFENRYLHRDGSYIWLLWSAYVSAEDELIYGVAKDVTDRKRSEERLRESERKYRDLVETSSDLIWSVDTHGRFTFVNRAARRIYGYEPEEMLGRPVADFESDEQRVRDDMAFRRLLSGTPLFNYETRHVCKDGRRVDLSINAIVLKGEDGAVLGATGTATDVTDRRRLEARQAAVAELGRRALEDVSLEEITEAAVTLVSDTLGLEYAEVLELLPDGKELRLHAGTGWPPATRPERVPAKDTPAGYAMELGGPVIVEEFAEERRFKRPAAFGQVGVRSGVCVPIEGEAAPFGVLAAHSTMRRSYSSDEVNFLQAVANVLATAIGRKRTEQRIVQLAAARGRLVAQTLAAEDRARRSISEVLHDHALQDLLASRQDLVEVTDEPQGDPERVVRAREGIERAVQLLRDAVFNLHPVVLQHAGLASAIRAVADHQGQRGNFKSVIEVDDDATGVHDELILSLARELLTNVAKHAEASNVLVRVRRDDQRIELTVEDDGRGIAPGRREQALHEGHVGLASSAERVEALAGTFQVEPRREGGTRARAELPARRAAGHRADTSGRRHRVSGRRSGPGR